jgi:hypothetical protein
MTRLGKWDLQLASTRLRRSDVLQMDEGSEATLNETEDGARKKFQQPLGMVFKAWGECWAWIKL